MTRTQKVLGGMLVTAVAIPVFVIGAALNRRPPTENVTPEASFCSFGRYTNGSRMIQSAASATDGPSSAPNDRAGLLLLYGGTRPGRGHGLVRFSLQFLPYGTRAPREIRPTALAVGQGVVKMLKAHSTVADPATIVAAQQLDAWELTHCMSAPSAK
jgi:hypothetical protein